MVEGGAAMRGALSTKLRHIVLAEVFDGDDDGGDEGSELLLPMMMMTAMGMTVLRD